MTPSTTACIAGANHGDELTAAANDVAAWFADRVSGATPNSRAQDVLTMDVVDGPWFE